MSAYGGVAPLTLVTVYHPADADYMRLQARSLARFLTPGTFAKIIVVENFPEEAARDLRALLLTDYAHLASHVVFLRARDIAPTLPAMNGWLSQQILKLAVSRHHVETGRYVVLDAKNHLVAPLSLRDLLAEDGLAFLHTHSYENHPLRTYMEKSLAYFGLDPRMTVRGFSQTVTPFVFYTQRVRDLLAHLEEREGRPFHETFVARGFTEFPLYMSYLLAQEGRLDGLYQLKPYAPERDPCQRHDPGHTIWPAKNDPENVRRAIVQVKREGSVFFALHRQAPRHLPTPSAEQIATFWAEKGLFGSVEDALQFLARQRRAQAKEERFEKLYHFVQRVKKQFPAFSQALAVVKALRHRSR